MFLEVVQTDLSGISWKYQGHDNLTQDERQALIELKEAKHTVIKRSDKGDNVVLMDDTNYEVEVKRLLSDQNTYRRLDVDPFPRVVHELNSKLDDAMEAGLLMKREYEHLFVDDFSVTVFYCIPKVHKSFERPPGRLIVSAIRGPVDKIGGYLDSLLKELVSDLKSYAQDTCHVLAKIADLKIEGEAWLISIDVKSLYTSIPHECGIAVVKGFLDRCCSQFRPQNEFLIEILQFALTNNFF